MRPPSETATTRLQLRRQARWFDIDSRVTPSEAAEVAHHAALYDEISSFELVAVASAGKLRNWAEQLLNERIYNRGDDDLGPVELPREPKT